MALTDTTTIDESLCQIIDKCDRDLQKVKKEQVPAMYNVLLTVYFSFSSFVAVLDWCTQRGQSQNRFLSKDREQRGKQL